MFFLIYTLDLLWSLVLVVFALIVIYSLKKQGYKNAFSALISFLKPTKRKLKIGFIIVVLYSVLGYGKISPLFFLTNSELYITELHSYFNVPLNLFALSYLNNPDFSLIFPYILSILLAFLSLSYLTATIYTSMIKPGQEKEIFKPSKDKLWLAGLLTIIAPIGNSVFALPLINITNLYYIFLNLDRIITYPLTTFYLWFLITSVVIYYSIASFIIFKREQQNKKLSIKDKIFWTLIAFIVAYIILIMIINFFIQKPIYY